MVIHACSLVHEHASLINKILAFRIKYILKKSIPPLKSGIPFPTSELSSKNNGEGKTLRGWVPSKTRSNDQENSPREQNFLKNEKAYPKAA